MKRLIVLFLLMISVSYVMAVSAPQYYQLNKPLDPTGFLVKMSTDPKSVSLEKPSDNMGFAVRGTSSPVYMVLISSVVESPCFSNTVSTLTNTGSLIANTIATAYVKNISISWNATASTGTFILYQNRTGLGTAVAGTGSYASKIFEVYIPSDTVTSATLTSSNNSNFFINKSYDLLCPLKVSNGLFGVLVNPNNTLVCTVDYFLQ